MPQDVLTGWTFERLILETAERCNVAEYGPSPDNRAIVPTDPANLDRIKRAVNKGYARFIRANPRWTFLERPLSLSIDAAAGGQCVNGETWRYLLPSYAAGNPKSDWRFVDANAGALCVISSSPGFVARLHDASPSTTGLPLYAAVRPLEPQAGSTLGPVRYEAIFYPAPDKPYALESDFRLFAAELVDLQDRHIAGAEHDAAILEAAVYEFDLQDNPALPEPTIELAKSLQLDGAKRVRRGATMRSTFRERQERLPGRRTILVNDQPVGPPTP